MLIPFAVFVTTLLLILGGYWALVLRPETQAEDAVRKRLATPARGETTDAPSLLKRVKPLSAIPVLDRVLRSSTSAVGPLQQLIAQYPGSSAAQLAQRDLQRLP